jgi:hypothetical protein
MNAGSSSFAVPLNSRSSNWGKNSTRFFRTDRARKGILHEANAVPALFRFGGLPKFSVLVFLLFSFASAAFAQDSPPPEAIAQGCGSGESAFEIASERAHPLAGPQNGKAIVYLIEDDRLFASRSRPTVDWGIDGEWIGATSANSYFYVYVSPGHHDLCTLWRVNARLTTGRQSSVASLIAEPGKAYYFAVADVFSPSARTTGMRLASVDEAQGKAMTSQFRHSTSKPSTGTKPWRRRLSGVL